MSFPCLQKYRSAPYIKVEKFEQQTLESGEVIECVKDAHDEYPDPEMFDLKNQMKAGIQLEEVNSKVLKAKSIDVGSVVRKYSKKKVENEETISD